MTRRKRLCSIAVLFVILTMSIALAATPAAAQRPGRNIIVVSSDDTVIQKSCMIRIHANKVIPDGDGNGVIHIRSDDITVEFMEGSVLRGASPDTPGDKLVGTGIRLNGHRNVTLKGLRVSGYRVGVHASRVSGLTIDGAEITDSFRRHLRSTPSAEHVSDWIYPHENDGNEWLSRYGAGVYVEDSTKVEIRNVRVRAGQNGIVLDAVNHSRIYDNDCSFLSGWGLALYRSSHNIISRNAFDFCIRGFSHGVYNRGQDSAGILMFEQCSENVIAENSATHCGDGLFAFAGREALGQKPAPSADFDYRRRGNNDNIVVGNDFSHAAAHGIELTFSFGNKVLRNRLAGNAICGLWGGYSQDTLIAGNEFIDNGEFGYGLERGGINIEHGAGNVIHTNRFHRNACAIHLWEDDDKELLETPWAKANHKGCVDNEVSRNRFQGDQIALQLRGARKTRYEDNIALDVGKELDTDDESTLVAGTAQTSFELPPHEVLGKKRPVGARKNLKGKRAIVMTPWGPWDHQQPLVRRSTASGRSHEYEVFGVAGEVTASIDGSGIRVRVLPATGDSVPRVVLTADAAGVRPYTLTLKSGSFMGSAAGELVSMLWKGRVFPWSTDPRKDFEQWKKESTNQSVPFETRELRLSFAQDGPRELELSPEVTRRGPGKDRFGMIVKGEIPLAPGTWRVRTLSDDGVRVLVDGARVLDNWTWHGPTEDQGVFKVMKQKSVEIEVLYFELDGYAVLNFELTRVADAMSALHDSIRESITQPEDCLKKILSHFDCVTGTIHRLSSESGLLELKAQVGIPEVVLGKVKNIPVGKGMAGIAAERREPVQVCNLQTDDSGVARAGAKETRMEGSIAVPMLVRGELRGVLGIAKPVAYEFTAEERADLLAIAAMLGE